MEHNTCAFFSNCAFFHFMDYVSVYTSFLEIENGHAIAQFLLFLSIESIQYSCNVRFYIFVQNISRFQFIAVISICLPLRYFWTQIGKGPSIFNFCIQVVNRNILLEKAIFYNNGNFTTSALNNYYLMILIIVLKCQLSKVINLIKLTLTKYRVPQNIYNSL